MKFFHIADTHLGAIPDAGFAWSEERRSEIWESFRSVVAKADREEVDLLLIAGDLFHRQPLMRELKEVNYLFSTLKKTKVVFIIGNHDYLKVDSYYLDFPWKARREPTSALACAASLYAFAFTTPPRACA